MNGITTYYLLNDIDFKDVDCTELKQIGYAQQTITFPKPLTDKITPFTIYLSNSSNGTTGVFGAVNITGIVKKSPYRISKVSITSKEKSTRRYKYFSPDAIKAKY